jgi:hypothetical protein
MPVVIYLQPGQTGELRRGDMVFQVAERKQGRWEARWMAHAGIAERSVMDYYLHQPAMVIHMGLFIDREIWWGGEDHKDLRVDVCGTFPGLDDLTRDDIIDEARAYYQIEPSVFQKHNIRSCYWMGDPNPAGHPLFPKVRGVYGFSCATFAHHCYSKIVGPLINSDNMPWIDDSERMDLEEVMPKYLIQEKPFRRLHTCYLICAFRDDDYPFNPANWEECKSHSQFIPLQDAAA